MLIRRLPVLLLLVVGAGCPNQSSNGPQLPDVALTPAYVGEPYRAELAPRGGTSPLTFAVEGLPPGFSFHVPAAVLEGTPRESGVWGIRIAVTDAEGRTDTRTYTLELLAEREPGGGDGGTDAGADGGTDAGTDGGTDAGGDAGTDGGGNASTPAHLTIANWNIEWFGDTFNGPGDETLQLNNAAKVISELDLDIWALGEIVDTAAFNALLAKATTLSTTGATYQGVLANAPSVSGGSASYDAYEQKVALVWKQGVLSDVSASIILSSYDHAFAGRPPLMVEGIAEVDGVSVPLTLVLLHMKASDDEASHDRRQAAATALKGYLDGLPSDREVIVLGDWNDDVDQSITYPRDTPYRALVDSSRYTFLTEVLSDNNISTTTGFAEAIDHQMTTAPLAARHVSGSTQVEHPSIAGYAYTTSDHYPVRSTFLLGMGDGGPGGGSDGGTDAGSDGGTDAGSDGGTGCPAPRVLINEVYFNPTPDLYGQPDYASTYIELYNPGTQAVSLQGWVLHDHDSFADGLPPRHVFGSRVLPAGDAVVVFSGAAGAAEYPGLPREVASTGEFRFNRSYRSSVGFIDAAILLDSNDALVDFASFSVTQVGVSNNRAPDATDCSEDLLLHSDVGGANRSPGFRVDGGAF